MDIFEFELRYLAYKWLNERFNLSLQDNIIFELIKISNKWKISKKIQEITPDELHEITIETFSTYKKNFLNNIKNEEKYKNIDWTRYSLADYINRLEYELKVIKEMWFNTYFLIVSDFVRRAKNNNIIVWPWRWSWAWSILAYLTQITDINPLKFNLLFERFLNPARITMPDFDIDFEDDLREKVIEYVTKKYWKEKVSSIWTYMKMAKKASFKDVARAMWFSFEYSNKVSNLLPEKWSVIDIVEKEDKEYTELINLYNSDNNFQKIIEISEKLEWNLRQLWVHACWIIIAPKEINNYSTIQYIKDDESLWIVSQYWWPTLETIWLLKMDFLWLRNLTVIKNCIKIITKKHENEGKKLPDLISNFRETASFHPPIDDKKTYENIFQTWNTTGIFQFESQWMRRFLIQLEPNIIDDLVAMNALYRPWPMEFIPRYIERKHWREKITYMTKELKEILSKKYWEDIANEEWIKLKKDLWPIMNITYWIAVYQEQLMFLVQAMAWFSLAEADILRRWVWKKKKDVIEKIKKEFIEKWKKYRNYKEETSKYIYEKMIEPAASYSFNKSHSVCYSYIAYQTAYLKSHFPVEFYASLMRSVEEDTDEIANYIYEVNIQWIKVLPPNVNNSFNHVAAIKNEIRLWFLSIKWVWFEIWETIQEERKHNWNFESLEDFLKRCESIINKKSLESLTKAWALDDFISRNTILKNIEFTLERVKSSKTMNMGLFWWNEITNKIVFPKEKETSIEEKLFMEYDVLRIFLSWHPLDWLYEYCKKYNFISQIKQKEDFWQFTFIWYVKNITRAMKKWFYVEFEDISWNIEFFVKDIIWIKKFDIAYVKWFRWRWKNLEKITTTTREKLIKFAWNSFNINNTVFEVRKKRANKNKIEIIEQIKNEKNIIKNEEIQCCKNINNKNEEKKQQKKYKIPKNIEILQNIANIIKSHKWNIKIYIWDTSFFINEDWINKIKKILN